MLDTRTLQIMDDIVFGNSTSYEVLMRKYDVSKRQLEYSVDKMNDYLSINHIPKLCVLKDGVIRVSRTTISLYQVLRSNKNSRSFISTGKVRLDMIILYMLSSNGKVTLDDLLYITQVSKNTVLSDISVLRQKIIGLNLNLVHKRQFGYVIEGSEFDKRNLASLVIKEIFELPKGEEIIRIVAEIKEEELQLSKSIISEVEKNLNVNFSDYQLILNPYTLAVILRRISNGYSIDFDETVYNILFGTKELLFISSILEEKCGSLALKEQAYITIQFLSISIINYNDFSTVVNSELYIAALEMIDEFEVNSCIEFNDKEGLMATIMAHLQPAFYRIKYGMTLSYDYNPEKELFDDADLLIIGQILKRSVYPIERVIGKSISQIELGFLTVLIASWLKKQGSKLFKRPRAIIVCPKGISEFKYMHVTLRELFPEFLFIGTISLREFKQYNEDEYDIVFSSIVVETEKIQFLVPGIINQQQQIILRNNVVQEVYGYSMNVVDMDKLLSIIRENAEIKKETELLESLNKYFVVQYNNEFKNTKAVEDNNNLSDYLPIENIQIVDGVDDWKEAIEIAAVPLLGKDVIMQEYVDGIIDSYENNKPPIVFGSDILVPHGYPGEYTKEVGMSFVRINEGIVFGEAKVNFVVLLSVTDKKKHLKAILQLLNLAENKTDIQMLMKAGNVDDIRNILLTYESQ